MNVMEHLTILNTDVAVARLLEDRSLYDALLRQFRDMHGRDLDKIDAAMRSGETTLMPKLVHALRGAASIVGAERLSAVASALLDQKRSADAPPLEKLRAVFELTLTAIARELGDSG